MQTDYIILGQGICGTLLSYELYRQGKSFIVIDDADPFASSRTASGLINPVTGKRHVKSWMFDDLLPEALETYHTLGAALGVSLVRSCEMVQFHASYEERDIFQEKAQGDPERHLSVTDASRWEPYFNYHYGAGSVAPCFLIDTPALLEGWRRKLETLNALRTETFSWSDCVTGENTITYKDIRAERIICCEGPAGIRNPYFSMLPFSLNKGEVIIARIPGLPPTHIYKQHFKILPLKEDLFWIGSSFEWKYEHPDTTDAFRNKVVSELRKWLKTPFIIEAQYAAERPSSVDYRPFAGCHPVHNMVGILNGMGTKGYSQAPFFAKELAAYLCNNKPVMPQADVRRYSGVLSNGAGLKKP